MKEIYKRAELEIYEFCEDDVIITSDVVPENDELPGRGFINNI